MAEIKEVVEITKSIVALSDEEKKKLAKHISSKNKTLARLAAAILTTVKDNKKTP